MAFVTDPDNLDRQQVIFNTDQRLLYVKGVGASKTSGSNGALTGTGPSYTFTASGETFSSDGVVSGDILTIATPHKNAAHWNVDSVDSETQLTVSLLSGDQLTPDNTETGINYNVNPATGGTVEPSGGTLFSEVGVTEQCLYSFSKEEWKSDSNLIKLQFPWELITREQGELGGGQENADWDFGNTVTTELIRTGGWAAKNTAGTVQKEYTCVVTLGTLDDDAQVYYQQASGGSATNFVRTGPVNQAIKTYTNPTPDYRDYLKIFVRKKGRSYAQSEIADIGVSTIETLVNRFPLAHQSDPAIVDVDAEIDCTSPYHTVITADTVTGADVTASSRQVTKTGENFTTTCTVGDAVVFTGGNNSGSTYIIDSVDSDTQLTLTQASVDEDALSDDTGTADFDVKTKMVRTAATDGALADVDGNTGTLTSSGSTFNSTDSRGVRAVAANDIVVITDAGSNHRGAYKVVSVDSATQLTLNTSDREFTTQSSIDFEIYTPGLHLESKEETRVQVSGVNITFTEAGSNDTITRASGSFITDGYEAGDLIYITGATNSENNGYKTVKSVAATVLTLNSTEDLVNEGPAPGITIDGTGHFARSGFAPDENDVFPFKWRVIGNSNTLPYVYQFLQRELRKTTDIDEGPTTNVGNVTDLLMNYVSPNGTTLNLIVDDLAGSELNLAAFRDARQSKAGTGSRNYPFVAGVTINLNQNLLDDSAANRIVVYFDDPDGTPSSGDEYGTPGAIIVDDKDGVDMDFSNQGSSPITTTFAYDTNTQGGHAAGTDADVQVVGIGKDNGQFVLASLTIQRANDNPVSLVSALERNYSNP